MSFTFRKRIKYVIITVILLTLVALTSLGLFVFTYVTLSSRLENTQRQLNDLDSTLMNKIDANTTACIIQNQCNESSVTSMEVTVSSRLDNTQMQLDNLTFLVNETQTSLLSTNQMYNDLHLQLQSNSALLKRLEGKTNKKQTRSIQRTQIPPRL